MVSKLLLRVTEQNIAPYDAVPVDVDDHRAWGALGLGLVENPSI